MMAAKEFFSVIIACIFADNVVFKSFLGIESAPVGIGRSLKKTAIEGIETTTVLFTAAFVCWSINTMIAQTVPYLQLMLFAVATLAVSSLFSFVFKKTVGFNLKAVAFNSVILGVCLVNSVKADSLTVALGTAIGAGLGFTLVALVLAAVRERINDSFVPKAWRGTPITVATLAIISMVVYAF